MHDSTKILLHLNTYFSHLSFDNSLAFRTILGKPPCGRAHTHASLLCLLNDPRNARTMVRYAVWLRVSSTATTTRRYFYRDKLSLR